MNTLQADFAGSKGAREQSERWKSIEPRELVDLQSNALHAYLGRSMSPADQLRVNDRRFQKFRSRMAYKS